MTEPDSATLAMAAILVGIPAAAALLLAAKPSPALRAVGVAEPERAESPR